MSKKIGEALVERGLLKRAEVERALGTQLLRGGHLGTSLIELGCIDEASLGRRLAELANLPYAPAEMFRDIPRQIIDVFSPELVQQRRVVPIGHAQRELHVAAIEPQSLAGLSVRTGLRIVPYIAPELRILEAMEQYYDIPLQKRFVRLSARSQQVKPRGPGPCRPHRLPLDRSPAAARPTIHPALEELSRRMSHVDNHGDLGQLILDYAGARMSRCILFDASGEQAQVADWRGVDFSPRKPQEIAVPITTRSIFALALDDRCYRGPLPDQFDRREFYGRLGIDVPDEILLMPIYGDDRLEAVLYGDDGGAGEDGAFTGEHDDDVVLLDRVGKALKMLSIRMELRSG